jgi:hypothetical protein
MTYRDGTEVRVGDVVVVHRGARDERGVVLQVVAPGTRDAADLDLPTGGVLIEGGGYGVFATAHIDKDEDIDFVSRGSAPVSAGVSNREDPLRLSGDIVNTPRSEE